MLDGINIDPIAFTIPIGDGFPIYWYGIIVTLGIAIGVIWAAREIAKRNQNVDEFFNGLIIVILSGYIFARLTYVLLEVFGGRGDQFQSFLDVINIRSGGINILGGFIGAAIMGWLYIRRKRLNFWHYADVAGPALLIAQGIGRWGNFINQELYGPPTTRPWGILIEPPYRLPQYSDLTQFPLETRFHPTFLYESFWLLLGFVVLLFLNHKYRDKWRPGTLFGVFLIWWGAGRAFIEFFRPDQPTVGSSVITYSFLMAIGLALVGVWIVLSRNHRAPQITGRRRQRVLKPKPRRES
ncbi:MAG: prolipoprotein diacylglyceryl transferase [Candidatus Promineofilum sp.]|nr:prolipoprotein diacylglyceryl transferase [Promineifilum sp.]